MTDGFATGFAVDSAQVRAHAAALDGLRDRFGAITAAGAAIRAGSASRAARREGLLGVILGPGFEAERAPSRLSGRSVSTQ